MRRYCFIATLIAIAGCSEEAPVGGSPQALTVGAVCTEDAEGLPSDAWVCPDSHTAECGAEGSVDLYVSAGDQTCEALELELNRTEFEEPGTYEVEVRTADAGAEPYCTAELIIADTQPPYEEANEAFEVWPPNHKSVRVAPSDCVTIVDDCDAAPKITFTGASSDEAPNDKGDGNTEPDIVFDGCDAVSLRAERQGGGDGRVYTLSYRAEDASGNVSEGTCRVVVPHDQGKGEATDSGKAYEVDAPDGCGDQSE